jgi:hypothetical protein
MMNTNKIIKAKRVDDSDRVVLVKLSNGSTEKVSDVISNIKYNIYEYYTNKHFGGKIIVFGNGVALDDICTEPNTSLYNNLDNLPDF